MKHNTFNQTVALLLTLSFVSASAQTSSALVFDEAIKNILQKHPDAAIEKSNTRISETRHSQSWQAFLPDLKLTAQQDELGDPRRKTQTYGLTSSVNLFSFGSTLKGLDAADELLQAQREDETVTAYQLELEAVQSILTFIKEKRRTEILNKVLETKIESYQIAQTRTKSGLLSQQELSQIYIDRANAEARFRDQQQEEHKARQHLASLLGHDRVELQWPWLKRITDRPAKLEKINLTGDPRWRKQERTLQASKDLESQAFRNVLPSLDLSATVGRSRIENADFTDSWSATILLSIPLYSRYQEWGQYRIRKESTIQAQMESEKLRRSLVESFENAQQNYKTSRESALAREQTRLLTEKLYRDNLLRFRSGRVSVNDLLLDQARLLDVDDLLLEGWYSAHLSWVALCHAREKSIFACE